MEAVQMTKNNLKCTFEECSSSFSRPFRLEAHLNVHRGQKPFVCGVVNCKKAYTNKAHLIRHNRVNHMEHHYIDKYICPTCKEYFANRQNLRRHIVRFHQERNVFHCNSCSQQFHKLYLLKAHEYLHTGIMPFSCKVCNRSFLKLSQLSKHKRRHQIRVCPVCRESFPLWSVFLEHTKKAHNDFICDICLKHFKSKAYLKSHLSVHAEAQQRLMFTCTEETCTKMYSRRSNLAQHIKSVHRKVTFDCSHCEAQLSTKQKLDEHLAKHSRGFLKRGSERSGRKRRTRKDKGSLRCKVLQKLCPQNEQSLV